MSEPTAYFDLDDKTAVWVPDDPRNRHRKMVDNGWLVELDPVTLLPLAGEIERAIAARPAIDDESEG